MTIKEMVTVNNMDNLIPVINPSLKEYSCMNAMLKYRIENTIEIDSSKDVKRGFELCFGEDIPQYADTIFNALNPLKAFCIYRLKEIGGTLYPFSKQKSNGCWGLRDDLLDVILLNIDKIFDGYDELRKQFDAFSDLMYCFANFVPVPQGFNAHKYAFGKGSYYENNDYPKFYYQNLLDGMDPKMLNWLTENMDRYYLRDMYELTPPFSRPNEYYDCTKYDQLLEYIKTAITAIKDRAKWLSNKVK